MKPKSIVAFLLLLSLLNVSCSSFTRLETVPSGAKVYVNGEYAGKTPYRYQDTKITGSQTEIRFEKENYESKTVYLNKDEEVNIGAVIGGFFFLFPFLWTMKYKSLHQYELYQNQQ